MKNRILSSLLFLMAAGQLSAEEFGGVTVTGNLTVGGTTFLNGNTNLGNGTGDVTTSSGDFRVNTHTRLGDSTGSDVTTIYGALNLTNLDDGINGNPTFNGNIIGNGSSNKLPNQTLGTGHNIMTLTLSDGRYVAKAGPAVIGSSNTVAGTGTHAIGNNITVNGAYQTIIGCYNLPGTFSATTWVETEPLFVVGNGTSLQASNALTILKNGATTVHGTLTALGNFTGNGEINTLPSQTLTGPTSILTRELADDLYAPVPVGGSYVTQTTLTNTLTAYYTQEDANEDLLDQSDGDARYLQPSALTPYRTIASSYSKTEADTEFLNQLDGDGRYFRNNSPQIVVGNHQVVDSNAAVIIANGVDAQNPSNALVIKKDGLIKVGQIEIDPAESVIKVPESGDINMGGYQ